MPGRTVSFSPVAMTKRVKLQGGLGVVQTRPGTSPMAHLINVLRRSSVGSSPGGDRGFSSWVGSLISFPSVICCRPLLQDWGVRRRLRPVLSFHLCFNCYRLSFSSSSSCPHLVCRWSVAGVNIVTRSIVVAARLLTPSSLVHTTLVQNQITLETQVDSHSLRTFTNRMTRLV